MSKRTIVGLIVIVIAAAAIIGGTVAYFSDTETSAGNTFKAGKFNLLVGSECTYNGQPQVPCTWVKKDLDDELFFNFLDVKPGDSGENTIELQVVNNDAWLCAEIANLKDYDNGCDSPENKVDNPTTSCGDPGEGEGELGSNLFFTVWKDLDCDNISDGGNETVLINNQSASSGVWPIADSEHGPAILGDAIVCYGLEWNVPIETNNIIQTDSLVGDIKFTAVQARNMNTFKCSDLANGNGGIGGDECTLAGCSDNNACTEEACVAGECAHYEVSCYDGNTCTVDTCNPASGCSHVIPQETCNGVDDDCDFAIDEDWPNLGQACDGVDSDLCAEGTYACSGGGLVCSDNTGGNPEICDGVDNDCDGENNEGGVCTPETNCRDNTDNDSDGHIDCLDAGCYFGSLDCQLNVCGNHICETGETNGNCPTDCSAPIAPECTSDAQCNDNKACTGDTCVNGSCVRALNNYVCPNDNSCQLATCVGAIPGADMWGCAYQATTPGASCWSTGCGLSGGCNGYTCNASGACVAPVVPPGGCTSDGQCSDGNACTNDYCQGSVCQHTNVVLGQCIFGGTCSGGVVTCNANPNCPNNCDDGDACTTDACGIAGCTHTATPNTQSCGNSAYETCNPSTGVHSCSCYLFPLVYPNCSIDIDIHFPHW